MSDQPRGPEGQVSLESRLAGNQYLADVLFDILNDTQIIAYEKVVEMATDEAKTEAILRIVDEYKAYKEELPAPSLSDLKRKRQELTASIDKIIFPD